MIPSDTLSCTHNEGLINLLRTEFISQKELNSKFIKKYKTILLQQFPAVAGADTASIIMSGKMQLVYKFVQIYLAVSGSH